MKVKVMGRTWGTYQPPTHLISCYSVSLFPERSYADRLHILKKEPISLSYVELDGSRHKKTHYNIKMHHEFFKSSFH